MPCRKKTQNFWCIDESIYKVVNFLSACLGRRRRLQRTLKCGIARNGTIFLFITRNCRAGPIAACTSCCGGQATFPSGTACQCRRFPFRVRSNARLLSMFMCIMHKICCERGAENVSQPELKYGEALQKCRTPPTHHEMPCSKKKQELCCVFDTCQCPECEGQCVIRVLCGECRNSGAQNTCPDCYVETCEECVDCKQGMCCWCSTHNCVCKV